MDPAIRDFLLIVGTGIATYFAAYLKRRGEDKAIKDGFSEVLRQTKETTQVTKDIEAKITDKVWDRQKQWEMKRELMFETTKRLSVAKDKLFSLYDAFRIASESNPDAPESTELKRKAATEFNEAMNALEMNAGLIDLVCSERLKNTVFEACYMVRQISSAIVNGSPEVFQASRKGQGDGLDACINAMRAEMGIERTIAPAPKA